MRRIYNSSVRSVPYRTPERKPLNVHQESVLNPIFGPIRPNQAEIWAHLDVWALGAKERVWSEIRVHVLLVFRDFRYNFDVCQFRQLFSIAY